MDNKRKASSANGGGSEADERAAKRRKMPPVSRLGLVLSQLSMLRSILRCIQSKMIAKPPCAHNAMLHVAFSCFPERLPQCDCISGYLSHTCPVTSDRGAAEHPS
ncbi:hypothetical protein BR93DRAFT_928938 [Coniochaeta sp. PMI_546]|nr:hypothetical protein BR93DRAFT_928938 [Coniochaeta sp. PMI_546]